MLATILRIHEDGTADAQCPHCYAVVLLELLEALATCEACGEELAPALERAGVQSSRA